MPELSSFSITLLVVGALAPLVGIPVVVLRAIRRERMPPDLLVRAILTIPFVVGIAAFLPVIVGANMAQRDAHNRFTRTSGSIETSTYQRSTCSDLEKSSPCYLVTLGYRYRFGNQEYFGTKVDMFNRSAFATESEAAVLVTRYPPGSETSVFVDPADPSNSVLDNRDVDAVIDASTYLTLLCFGVFVVALLFVPRRSKVTARTESQPPRHIDDNSERLGGGGPI